MKTQEAVSKIISLLKGDEVVISANGFISRELHDTGDSERNFYMIGSMGMAPSIGAGIALNSKKKVVVLDGDGNVLMNMGALATIGNLKPENFIHIVIDNGVYESTGSQKTVSPTIELENVAKAAGYTTTVKAETIEELESALVSEYTGPVFIRVMVEAGKREVGRVQVSPEEITERMRKYLS
ncbi:MAG: thiamine pyrophosphate-dependent enzyme [Candidatus Undinarchaeales archaeon]|jgi:sulfopyruvate decarboxylase beta subunit|nr:thiamine pyrophosphate-dependent enzyme [Candidatus Undinarchaeales archaeon]